MPRYKIIEADDSVRIVQARNLAEAIGLADVPYSVGIDEECPAHPKHEFVQFTGLESEGKTEFCRICGLTR